MIDMYKRQQFSVIRSQWPHLTAKKALEVVRSDTAFFQFRSAMHERCEYQNLIDDIRSSYRNRRAYFTDSPRELWKHCSRLERARKGSAT